MKCNFHVSTDDANNFFNGQSEATFYQAQTKSCVSIVVPLSTRLGCFHHASMYEKAQVIKCQLIHQAKCVKKTLKMILNSTKFNFSGPHQVAQFSSNNNPRRARHRTPFPSTFPVIVDRNYEKTVR